MVSNMVTDMTMVMAIDMENLDLEVLIPKPTAMAMRHILDFFVEKVNAVRSRWKAKNYH